MRWSIEELYKALHIYKERGFYRKIKYLPRSTWRRTKVLFKWIFSGYTQVSLWDLDNYFIEVVLFRLKKFQESYQYSYPARFDNEQEWDIVLETLIDKWQKMKDEFYLETVNSESMSKQEQNDKEALELFAKNFHSFWD